jgi:RHS repeat-associated protein
LDIRSSDGHRSVGGPTRVGTSTRADRGGAFVAAAAPVVTLPKGGGAIRGIGEKFAANPVTGTGTMSVPIATSAGRSGFGPELSFSYDSGTGNGPFGFGWTLSHASITRKTDQGVPRYLDEENSDDFILSGAEDLVPLLDDSGAQAIDTTTAPGYTIHRFRPRVEGMFARIERWTRGDGDVHWRSITKDNILSLYGQTLESRIVDPDRPSQIFSWLICETRDDRGNGIAYEYKEEDGMLIDLTQACERNRGERNDRRRRTNRYVKRIRYGNRVTLLDPVGKRPPFIAAATMQNADWMFEIVFDYGEHDAIAPVPSDDPALGNSRPWPVRADPFSTYRSGFEVRTLRRCRRVLMFHHFPTEPGVGADCLVRSTDLAYSGDQPATDAPIPIYSFLASITQTGYKRTQNGGGYLTKSLPPLEFRYTQPIVEDAVHDVDPESLENLPYGLDEASYRWVDLHGEGVPGILTEQATAWFYKRNLSPLHDAPAERGQTRAKFGPLERVAVMPNASVAGTSAQFLDLAGDGQPDLVMLGGPTPGLYEHDGREGWTRFRPFLARLNRDPSDPHMRFVDLDGDGRADVLISEDDAFVWHASLGEDGFGPPRRVPYGLDEEKGPRLVLADPTQSIYLADMNGDGLTDLVRIRNGEVCYWPNLGYGRFGAKISTDNPPHFDHPDQFDHSRLRLADIDGSGTADIIYLHRDGIQLFFNRSGNGWSAAQPLSVFPRVDDLASIVPVDLLGNGTACLVWSSPLPGDTPRQMRYVNLMGGTKPHLLEKAANNLGAETHIDYAPSTRFYLRDKNEGRPWVTRLPFPVHVVERVETYDYVSRNRFVTRYAYHHGYFDGEEREFRGFGMVEQWDTESFASLSTSDAFPVGDNVSLVSHVPPVHTKTWFHTGVDPEYASIARPFEASSDPLERGEYYREPGLTNTQARALLLPDTRLPAGLTLEDEREACRALKGSMLRREVYALDRTSKSAHPYVVTEQTFDVRCLQERGSNRHGVFFTHVREAINYHYERDPRDPRVSHALTLEVDDLGNVLKEAAVGYGRRQADTASLGADSAKQTLTLVTYTESLVTGPIDDLALYPNDYRVPARCESRTYELTGYAPTGSAGRFQFADFVRPDAADPRRLTHIFDSESPYERPASGGRERRLIQQERTLFRPDDLGASVNDPLALLPFQALQPLGLQGESYRLALTAGLVAQVFQRNGQSLLPDPVDVLQVDAAGGRAADRGGYVELEPGLWWIRTGRTFLSAATGDSAAQELARARLHFFLPQRYRDPFQSAAADTETIVTYDTHDLLIEDVRDALGNRVTLGERPPTGGPGPEDRGNDYRVLLPWRATDANGNRTYVAYDALGMVVGTAVMGKRTESLGDSFSSFVPDVSDADALDHLSTPFADPHGMLGTATTRLVYDLGAYFRTKTQLNPRPAVVCVLARETHVTDLGAGEQTRIQQAFSYSDGYGREIQRKVNAEPGPLIDGGPLVNPRWVGSGWTIFNNKGKAVRVFEPFFSDTHRFEFARVAGVSAVTFYDPIERVVATLHPNHTYEKTVYEAWKQVTFDANDTVAAHAMETGDPRTDPDIRGYVEEHFKTLPSVWRTWHQERIGGEQGPQERAAARRSAIHANTPTTVHFDVLARPFATEARNRFERAGVTVDETHLTRSTLDVEGNLQELRDAVVQSGDPRGRIVVRYAYDMLGNRIHQSSMEAGQRWMLNDVAGKSIRSWDSRGHNAITTYDALRRPVRQFVRGTTADSDPRTRNRDLLVDRVEYGEDRSDAAALNLRTRISRHSDGAGVVTNVVVSPLNNQPEAYDFKGNQLRTSRQFLADYTAIPDWLQNPTLDPETFASSTRYDALNRPVQTIAPHSGQAGLSVIRQTFNEASLVERLDVWLDQGMEPSGLLDATVLPASAVGIANIDYDAKGRRVRVDYKNGTSTRCSYDRDTFRLARCYTRRGAAFTEDCTNRQPPPATIAAPGEPPPDLPCGVQNLRYTYDPAGNITTIEDSAQQTIYFSNTIVEPRGEYTYDALYRLVEATGREHLGQVGGQPIPHSHDDDRRVGIDWAANDGNAMGTYTERYIYDAAGNCVEMQHQGGSPQSGWTRRFSYLEASQIEDGSGPTPVKRSNRLSSTETGANGSPDRYLYDPRGNVTRLPHLGGTHLTPNLHWDHRDQLRRADLPAGPVAYYIYDAGGVRARKVWEKSATLVEERLYLGGFEIFRRRGGAGAIQLERQSLHVMDAKQRVAIVETRTIDSAGTDRAAPRRIRYQFANHLGSSTLELDEQAAIVSYEEYTPYGSTSYSAVSSQTETPKRYRHMGKERDEESGMYYCGARYYAPWLARWSSTDPLLFVDGVNLYRYVRNNPLRLIDPSGTQPVVPEVNTGDPLNFKTYDEYRAANPDQPEETVRHVWYSTYGKKYLILYDKGNDEFKRQAQQAAKDHNTTAQSVEADKIGPLIAKNKPDVIMSFGHGISSEMSTGDGQWIGAATLKRELKEAAQTKDIRFVAQACSCGVKGGLMDTLHADADLKNYTFASHIDSGHVTRNSSIRFAGGQDLQAFLVGKVGELGFKKKASSAIVSELLRVASDKETLHTNEINLVIREIGVLGFDQFWALLNSKADVKNDTAVLDLNLAPDALDRFAKGMDTLRSRLDASVAKRTPPPPLKHHVTETR